jgi:outer membrane protein
VHPWSIGLGVLLLALLAAPDTLSLTFQEALERAYNQAPAVRLAGVEIEEKEFERLKALSEFFPKLTGQAQIMRLDEAPRIKTEFSGIPIELTLGDEKVEVLQYGIQLPLWTFGRRLQGYALAEEATQLARLDSCQIKRSLRLNVTELYTNIIALAEAEVLTQTALDNASKHRQTIEDKYNQGLVSHYELLQAETKEAELFPELVDVREQAKTLTARLGIILNLGPDTVLVLERNWNLPDKVATSLSFDEVLERRPAWQQIELGQQMLERQIKIKQREALPVLAAGANYSMQRSPLTNGEWDGGWSYSLSAQMPISAGFANYAEVKRLEKEKEKLTIQADALRTQIRFEIQEAAGELATARARLGAAKRKQAEAEELLSIVSERNREGLSSDIDLLDAELGLRKACTDKVMAERDLIVAHEKWINVIGGEQ